MLARSPLLAGFALCLTCLGVGGCRHRDLASADQASQTDAERVPAASADLLQMLTALGDRGVYVVALRDADWRESVGPLLELFGAGSSVEQIHTPVALLRGAAELLEIPVRAGELVGRDPSRPIVASLFEASIDGAMLTANALQPLRGGSHPSMREQVLIPALDTNALLGSVAELLSELEAWPELVAGRPNARAWQLAGGFVAALPEADSVRVVISHGGSGLDPVADLASWQAQLDSSAAAPVDTPALRHFGQADAGLALLVRPWRIRAAITWEGLRYGRLAVADAPADQRELALARATEIMLGSELMMPDDGAELDDWALTMTRSDGVVRVRAVASATEIGQRVLAAARVSGSSPIEHKLDKLTIESWLSLDRGIAAATGSPTAALPNLRVQDAADLWRNCGIGCPVHAALRMPFGTSRSPIGGLLHIEIAKLLDPDPAVPEPVSMRIATAGPALTIELVLGGPDKLGFTPNFSGMQWSSPMRSAAASPGDACIARAGLGAQRALATVFESEPDKRAGMMLAEMASYEEHLRCATEHPTTAAAAAALRRIVLEAAVAAELGVVDFEGAQALLELGCTKHADPQLCARKDLFAAAPKPKLASSPLAEACLPALEWSAGEVHGLPLLVTADALALGERSLVGEKQAIAAAILANSSSWEDYREVAPLALLVDRAAEFRSLRPVLDALGTLDVRAFAFVIQDGRGRIYSLPMRLRVPKSAKVTTPEDEPPPPSNKKSGLYAMKGPKDAIPQMDEGRRGDGIVLELDVDNVTITRPGGKPEQLTLAQLTELSLERENLELRVSEATPWSSVVTLASSACPLTITLDHSSE